jgi:hypothetical protein
MAESFAGGRVGVDVSRKHAGVTEADEDRPAFVQDDAVRRHAAVNDISVVTVTQRFN